MSKTELFSAEELTHPTTSGEIVRPRPRPRTKRSRGWPYAGPLLTSFGALRAYFRGSSRARLGGSFSVRPARIPFLNEEVRYWKRRYRGLLLPYLHYCCHYAHVEKQKSKGWPCFHSYLTLRNGDFFVPPHRSPLMPFHAVSKMLINDSMYVFASSFCKSWSDKCKDQR